MFRFDKIDSKEFSYKLRNVHEDFVFNWGMIDNLIAQLTLEFYCHESDFFLSIFRTHALQQDLSIC